MPPKRARRGRPNYINALPDEVLAHILYLAQVNKPCFLREHRRIQSAECLSHVCSLWRNIAFGLPVLWSHIDIIPTRDGRTKRSILARAHALAKRAGNTLLAIHICDQTLHSNHWDSLSFLPFCESVGARMGSLHICIESYDHLWRGTYDYLSQGTTQTISDFVLNCVPGMLTRLVLEHRGACTRDRSTAFITEEPSSSEGLESLFLPITILELDGTHPDWTSQAYHGLVELRLLCSKLNFSGDFTASDLAVILGSSPELRVLQVGLGLSDDGSTGSSQVPHEPIRLGDLEVLDLKLLSPHHQRIILSLIVPGSKPLELFSKFPEGAMSLLAHDEFVKFFKRSNITRLHLNSESQTSIIISQLLKLLPNLQLLDLENFQIFRDCNCCRLENSLRSQLYTLRIR